jgi:hypothetical protein
VLGKVMTRALNPVFRVTDRKILIWLAVSKSFLAIFGFEI